jgi:hypothetical protein
MYEVIKVTMNNEPLTMNPKMGLYHHRDLIGSREAFIKENLNI